MKTWTTRRTAKGKRLSAGQAARPARILSKEQIARDSAFAPACKVDIATSTIGYDAARPDRVALCLVQILRLSAAPVL